MRWCSKFLDFRVDYIISHSLAEAANVKGATVSPERVYAPKHGPTVTHDALVAALYDKLAARLGQERHGVLHLVPILVEHRLEEFQFFDIHFRRQFHRETRSELDCRTNLFSSHIRRKDSVRRRRI